MSLTDDALEQVGRLFKENAELRTELARVRAELDARIAAESADAAAGSYAGRAEEAEAARDAAQAEATLLRRALIGRRHFPAGVMRTPMDERTEAIRVRWDEFCFSGPSETDRERDQVIGWLLDRMDSATERAEKAEAALAEMRKRPCGEALCVDVERERDEFWIELQQFRHEKAEQEARRTERKPVSIGTGMPGTSHLEAFGQYLRDAFGATPYHVGSSIHGKTWRDVDVRVMLDDDRFDALFPGYAAYGQCDAWWSLLCAARSVLGEQRTGLPIDCQVQRTSDANEKFPGARNPLFVGLAEDDHRPTMQAPRTALERAADEHGVQPVRDVAELGAGDDGPSDEEFAAFDAARREGGGDA